MKMRLESKAKGAAGKKIEEMDLKALARNVAPSSLIAVLSDLRSAVHC